MIVNLVTEFGLERNRLLYPACACAHGVNSIIGASLSEPHSSEDNAEVVCLSVMDRHGPRFDVFSFDDSYL